jgi:hypothetical protein
MSTAAHGAVPAVAPREPAVAVICSDGDIAPAHRDVYALVDERGQTDARAARRMSRR